MTDDILPMQVLTEVATGRIASALPRSTRARLMGSTPDPILAEASRPYELSPPTFLRRKRK